MPICGCICACVSCLKPYCSPFPFKTSQYQLPLTMVSTEITLVQVFFVLCAFQPENCFTPLGFVRESFMSILCLQIYFMHSLSLSIGFFLFLSFAIFLLFPKPLGWFFSESVVVVFIVNKVCSSQGTKLSSVQPNIAIQSYLVTTTCSFQTFFFPLKDKWSLEGHESYRIQSYSMTFFFFLFTASYHNFLFHITTS